MKSRLISITLLVCEVVALVALFLLVPFGVLAGIGSPNATVISSVSILNTQPVVINISTDGGGPITLVPNATRPVSCMVVVEDFDGDTDISSVNATFYDSVVSSDGDSDDNNYHYTNSSCFINTSYGTFNGYVDDEYRALANCTFDVEYYANPALWTCNATAFDASNASGRNHGNVTVSQLLALGLPDTIDYGQVNATEISNENYTNITNYGNTVTNLSLEGYSVTPGDGNAMNCSLGALENISIEHEKYNLTTSNTSSMTLEQAHPFYTNLTTTPTIRFFNLTARTNDTANDIWKTAYWRIYVPVGVAGNCTGNIVFGATTADGS